jgi:hypothetical protein
MPTPWSGYWVLRNGNLLARVGTLEGRGSGVLKERIFSCEAVIPRQEHKGITGEREEGSQNGGLMYNAAMVSVLAC